MIIIGFFFAICILRLAQMQLVQNPSLDEKIERLKLQQSKMLTTARGKIIDRKGRNLAIDEPYFELQLDYLLSRWIDQRIETAMTAQATARSESAAAIRRVQEQVEAGKANLEHILQKAEKFGINQKRALELIEKHNNDIWRLREHLAWKRNFPDSNDFNSAEPDINERLRLILRVDIAEMHEGFPLIELHSDDEVFAAQKEFAHIKEVKIVPKNKRVYPYNSTACQTIGWVGPEQQRTLFSDDPFSSYLEGEISGRPPGVEYVCETILRGRRGIIVYDIDRELVMESETQLGEDVILTIDIELQRKIENLILNCDKNSNCQAPTSIVVIDIPSGDILALVSTPTYNLNLTRFEYGDLISNKDEPLRNRALNAHYPPGSVAKPLILIAGLETGKISTGEVISCPAAPAPQGWPNCWIYNRYRTGHDGSWSNYARNAIKGSCNIYFSRLAHRIEPSVLQKWLWQLGFGHEYQLEPIEVLQQQPRRFRQTSGIISSSTPTSSPKTLSNVMPLSSRELRFFAIGQGNFRATPLQVANAMATIGRKGLYKEPRLILSPSVGTSKNISLNFSPNTSSVIFEGMAAVVNESGGTAYREFRPMLNHFSKQGVTVYGKTGSTQRPEHAWFGGFAMDKAGRGVAIAVLVEGGQHGSDDAAPLTRDTIQFCIEAGYLGEFIPLESQD